MSPTHKDSSVARLLAALATRACTFITILTLSIIPITRQPVDRGSEDETCAHGGRCRCGRRLHRQCRDVRMSLIPGAPAPR